jgi:hypothetical protein
MKQGGLIKGQELFNGSHPARTACRRYYYGDLGAFHKKIAGFVLCAGKGFRLPVQML